MIIQDLFSKDINRSINRVVKVQDASDESVRQELDEYVVTRELQGHLRTSSRRTIRRSTFPPTTWACGSAASLAPVNRTFSRCSRICCKTMRLPASAPSITLMARSPIPSWPLAFVVAARFPPRPFCLTSTARGGQWKEGDTSRTALLRAFERVFFEHLGFLARTLSSHAWSSISTARVRRRSFALPTSASAKATGSRTVRVIATLRITSSRPRKRSWA